MVDSVVTYVSVSLGLFSIIGTILALCSLFTHGVEKPKSYKKNYITFEKSEKFEKRTVLSFKKKKLPLLLST